MAILHISSKLDRRWMKNNNKNNEEGCICDMHRACFNDTIYLLSSEHTF